MLTFTKQRSYCLILVTTISINLQCTLSIEGFTCHQHTLFSSDWGTKPSIVLKNILYLLMSQNKTEICNHEIWIKQSTVKSLLTLFVGRKFYGYTWLYNSQFNLSFKHKFFLMFIDFFPFYSLLSCSEYIPPPNLMYIWAYFNNKMLFYGLCEYEGTCTITYKK